MPSLYFSDSVDESDSSREREGSLEQSDKEVTKEVTKENTEDAEVPDIAILSNDFPLLFAAFPDLSPGVCSKFQYFPLLRLLT
jgi:hypothetical protein